MVGPDHKGVAHFAVPGGWVLLRCTYSFLYETFHVWMSDPVVTTFDLTIECANTKNMGS